MKTKKVFGLLVLAIAFFAGLIGVNGCVKAAEFRPMITITNSNAPALEPIRDYTGDISWATGANFVPGMTLEFALEIDYDLRLFKTVKVDGNELRLNVDYTLEEGSTVIVFNTEYLNTLAPGTHNVEVLFTNGMTFTTSFVVSDDPNMVVPNTGGQYIKDAEGGNANVGGLLIVLSAIIVVGVVIFRIVRVRRFGKESWWSMLTSAWSGVISKVKNVCYEKINALKYKWVERQARFTTRKTVSVGVAAVLTMTLLGFGLVKVLSHRGEATATLMEAPESLAIRTSESDYAAEVDLKDGNKFVHTSQDVTVEASTRGGYKLFIETNSDKWNDLSINGSAQADERITAGTGTASTPVKLEADEWGYATEGGVFGSDYTPSTTSLWAGVPVYGSEALLKSVDGATSADSTTKVYYGFNITNNLPDGKYWGTENHAVIYVAVANVLPDYPIVYDCNGGTGSIAEQTKPADGSIQLSDGTGCVKGDASIVAWNTNRAGTGQSFAKGDIYEGNERLYLYAIWDDTPGSDLPERPKYTYKLMYNLNGGTAVNPSDFNDVTSSETEEDTYTFTLTSSEPTREGYAFQGWSRGSVCITIGECSNGDVYSAGASVRVTKVDTVMHAVWKDNATGEIPLVDGLNYTYVLHYDARGGSGSTNITFPDVKMDTVEFPVNVTPVMEGYQFNGWYNPSTGLTIMPADTAKLTVDKLETTLYAIWAKEYAYILNYDANGGAGAPAQQIVTSAASTVSFQISSTVPTRDGYEFLGWTKVKNDSSTTGRYAPGSTLSDVTAAKTTLYAAWNKVDVKVSSISVSKSKDYLYYNDKSDKENNNHEGDRTMKLTATVLPNNAKNTEVEMTSLNNNIATVNSSSGIVTAVDAGEATIRVKAKDGSGVYSDVKVKVYKDIIVVIGSSKVRDFSQYVDENEDWPYGKGDFSVSDGTLMFVYKSAGADAAWQYGDGLKKVETDIISKYKGRGEYVRFYLHFPMAGNTVVNHACDSEVDFRSLGQLAVIHQGSFKTAVTRLRSQYGINKIYGVISSIPPVKPSQVSDGNNSVVGVSSAKACSKGYRSNKKYYIFNKYLSNASYDGDKIVYIPMFSVYLDTPNSLNVEITKNNLHFKEKYTGDPYKTTDGVHMTKTTARDYLEQLFDATFQKIPIPY